MTDSPAPTDRARYALWQRERIRYLDSDMQGHVNNLAIGAMAENGRVELLRQHVHARLPRGMMMVTVRVLFEYRGQLFYPGEVDVGTAFIRVGNSSVTVLQGIFGPGGCAANVEAVSVLTDRASKRAVPWPDDCRAALEALRLGESLVACS